jgi:hypothetical protein
VLDVFLGKFGKVGVPLDFGVPGRINLMLSDMRMWEDLRLGSEFDRLCGRGCTLQISLCIWLMRF